MYTITYNTRYYLAGDVRLRRRIAKIHARSRVLVALLQIFQHAFGCLYCTHIRSSGLQQKGNSGFRYFRFRCMHYVLVRTPTQWLTDAVKFMKVKNLFSM